MQRERRNKIRQQYGNATNMSAGELRRWSKNPCSKKASLSRAPLKRNMRLFERSNWTQKDFENAMRTISYQKRASGIKRSDKTGPCGYTRNERARKNWGFDVKKGR